MGRGFDQSAFHRPRFSQRFDLINVERIVLAEGLDGQVPAPLNDTDPSSMINFNQVSSGAAVDQGGGRLQAIAATCDLRRGNLFMDRLPSRPDPGQKIQVLMASAIRSHERHLRSSPPARSR